MPFRTQAGGGLAQRWSVAGGANQYHVLSPQNSNTTFLPTEGLLTATLCFGPSGGLAIDRLAAEVTVVGTAGALVRLGLYADAAGVPGALLVDAGTIDGTVLNFSELVIPALVLPTTYWACYCVQGAAGTRPTIRAISGNGNPILQLGPGHTNLNNVRFTGHWVRSGAVAGALPNPFGSPLPTENGVWAVGRAAA